MLRFEIALLRLATNTCSPSILQQICDSRTMAHANGGYQKGPLMTGPIAPGPVGAQREEGGGVNVGPGFREQESSQGPPFPDWCAP